MEGHELTPSYEHKGSPRILKWVTYPFSSGSSQPRNQTRVFCIAGRFFHQLSSQGSVLDNHSISHLSSDYWKKKNQVFEKWKAVSCCLDFTKIHLSTNLNPNWKFALTSTSSKSPLTGLWQNWRMPPWFCSSFHAGQHCSQMFLNTAPETCLLSQTSSLNCWRAQAGHLYPSPSGSQHREKTKQMPGEPNSMHQKVNFSFGLGFLLCPPFTSVTFPVSWKNALEATESSSRQWLHYRSSQLSPSPSKVLVWMSVWSMRHVSIPGTFNPSSPRFPNTRALFPDYLLQWVNSLGVKNGPLFWKGERRKGNSFIFKSSSLSLWSIRPVFLPGKSHGQRLLVGWSPWGRPSWTWLSD